MAMPKSNVLDRRRETRDILRKREAAMGRRRLLWHIVNLVVLYFGLKWATQIDFDSADPYYSVTLPLRTMGFAVWMLLVLFIEAFRRGSG
ncbi:hypothetical protein GYB61_04890 [bacterium]|nr:hypothetical protein [bacterium]